MVISGQVQALTGWSLRAQGPLSCRAFSIAAPPSCHFIPPPPTPTATAVFSSGVPGEAQHGERRRGWETSLECWCTVLNCTAQNRHRLMCQARPQHRLFWAQGAAASPSPPPPPSMHVVETDVFLRRDGRRCERKTDTNGSGFSALWPRLMTTQTTPSKKRTRPLRFASHLLCFALLRLALPAVDKRTTRIAQDEEKGTGTTGTMHTHTTHVWPPVLR